MLFGAFAVLSVTILLGMFLASTTPASRGDFARWPLVHGLCGAAGLAFLALAWQRARLSGPFAMDALGLISLGLLVGLTMAVMARRGRPLPAAALIVHAALAGIGYLIVAGFALG